MLTEILLLLLVLVVAALMIVDQARTRGEGAHGPADSPLYGGGLPAAVPSHAGMASAFSPEPSRSVVPPPSIGPRLGGLRPGTSPVPDEVSRRAQQPAGRAPAPVGAGSAGDAGEAGGVFDQMRREISRLSANEAELGAKLNDVFVNLAHRSRLLAERQIRLVESLAHGEQDERRLASLEKMSRIATRMYRSSMNLLILAGQEPASGSSQPAALTHLVQAAASDIEETERISFEVQPEIAVRGPAPDDLVHLLAELLQNGASFSAANMPVRVSAHAVNTGGVVIDISDHGIGMTDKELAFANWQLENPPATTIDATKWMGLLVVARLAVRHGIKVRLTQAEQGGLTALVWLPAEILLYHSPAANPGAAHAGPGNVGPGNVGPGNLGTAAAAYRAPRAEPTSQLPMPGQVPGAQPAYAAREDAEVVLPSAEGAVATRRLPIFDEMESRWSGAGAGAVQTVDPPPMGGGAAPALPTRRPAAKPGGQQEH
jgi:hypothetical protein